MEDVLGWTEDDVCSWLGTLRLGSKTGEIQAKFQEDGIDGGILCELTVDECQELGLGVGHRKKIMTALWQITHGAAGMSSPSKGMASPRAIDLDNETSNYAASPTLNRMPNLQGIVRTSCLLVSFFSFNSVASFRYSLVAPNSSATGRLHTLEKKQ